MLRRLAFHLSFAPSSSSTFCRFLQLSSSRISANCITGPLSNEMVTSIYYTNHNDSLRTGKKLLLNLLSTRESPSNPVIPNEELSNRQAMNSVH
jgi:hypothetical protein